MAKQEPTLFEKLQIQEEQKEEQNIGGWQHSITLKIVIFLCTTLACAFFFPFQIRVNSTLSVGSEWSEESVTGKFAFPIYKPASRYEKETQEAREKATMVFVNNEVGQERSRKTLQSILQMIAAPRFNADSVEIQTGVAHENTSFLLSLPPAKRVQIVQKIGQLLQNHLRTVYADGFINIPKSAVKSREIALRTSMNTEIILPLSSLTDSTDFRVKLEENAKIRLSADEVALALEIGKHLPMPNLLFSDELTKIARNSAAVSVPQTLGIVRAEELIIAKGERITELALLKLQSYQNTRLLWSDVRSPLLTFLGNFIHSLLVYALLLLYLFFIRRRIFNHNGQIAGLSFMLVLIAAITWASVEITTELPLQYLIILPAFSMLIAILFDSRTGFYSTVTAAFLIAGVRGNDYETAFAVMIAGTFAAYTVRDLRSRTQVFRSIASSFAGIALTLLAFGLEHSTDVPVLGRQILVASVNSVISPLITLGLLFLIERALNIATDLRLLEYDNLFHPLLLELSEKAPGTYQHTLSITLLAESAARAVDANPILAKVGAHFHDIGKIAKSEYFVENQINIGNKHDRLSPLKSATIIRNHVEDGIELGKQYKLPQRILDFIPMHHGTMLIKYFYAKALEEAKEKGTIVNEDDFRYPGPKPVNKETAIVMLADAVEAVYRTLDTSDREAVENAIDTIVKDRLLDGQLDESDLTMKDLTLIKESFVKNLVGMGHQRIKYKEIPKPDDGNGDEEAAEKE